MDKSPEPTLAQQLAAAHDWWGGGGVDGAFSDQPRNWLEQPDAAAARGEDLPPEAPSQPARPAEPELPPLGGDGKHWPKALAALAPWWLGEGDLETGGAAPRVPPRGAADAELMVLVPMPEAGDGGRLLAGPQGKLVGNMLAAMGIGEDAAYLAAALPRHASHPDWQA